MLKIRSNLTKNFSIKALAEAGQAANQSLQLAIDENRESSLVGNKTTRRMKNVNSGYLKEVQ